MKETPWFPVRTVGIWLESAVGFPNYPGEQVLGALSRSFVLTPTRLIRAFLYRWFSSERTQTILRSFGQQTTNISNLNTERCLNLPFHYPPLAEQQRIADILDRAEALRANRRAALDQLDTLTQAIFFEMFGDPIANPLRWPTSTLGDQLSFQLYGPRFYNELYTEDGTRIVRITDLDASGNLNFSSMPRLAVSPSDLEKYAVRQGDILFARTGATVGKVALIPPNSPVCIAGAYFILMRFVSGIDPAYARGVLIAPSIQAIVWMRSQQSAQQNFSGPGLRALPMPVPPLKLQQEFARRVAAIEQLREAQRSSLAKLDELFSCLQHRAFRGEL